MKAFKYRDKYVLLLKKELHKIHSRSTLLNIRGSVRKATKYLNEVVDFVERYDADLLAVRSVKVKNLYLARALQNERERSNRLLQEKIEIQSAYHDALREKAELKRENWNLEQQLISDLEDFKGMLPNIVELSEHVTKRIMKYDSIRKNISTKRSMECLPPRCFPNRSFGNNPNQPVSAVNPMVKGYVIQKPTINVRRVPFPDEPRSSMFEYVNINSPILEEPEESVSPANNLTRRCENGLRSALNVSSRRRIRRPELPAAPTETNFCDPPPAEDNQVNVHLEPVVRLEDVTRLLQHSSIRISGTPTMTPERQSTNLGEVVNQHWSPEVLIPKISTPMRPVASTEDPLEGSSWMHKRSSVNNHEDRSQSNQNNSIFYQSRVQFTPDYIRPSPKFNHRNTKLPTETTLLADETHSQSTHKRKFFQSCKSPSTSADLQVSQFYPDLQDVGDSDVVSSSNVDDAGNNVPLTMVTERRRKRTIRTRFSCLPGETDEDVSQNSVRAQAGRRSVRLRKSVRMSASGEYSETKLTEDKSIPKKSLKNRKHSDSAEANNPTLEDSEIVDVRQSKKSKRNSKKTINESNVSSSDLDDSSRLSRSSRNRSNVSYKEPSTRTKLRRT